MLQLDKAILDYLSILLERGFTQTSAFENAGYGYAERAYTMDHIMLKATCERGLCGFELGCVNHPEQLIDGSSFRDLLDPPNEGRWNLGMGAAAFINEHWTQIYEMLKPINWPTTLQRIEAIRRRS